VDAVGHADFVTALYATSRHSITKQQPLKLQALRLVA
jgi:hypothetical protein